MGCPTWVPGLNPRKLWQDIRTQPLLLVGTVVVAWLLVSLPFIFQGLVLYAELDQWSEVQNCTLLSSVHADECRDGPGAGGVGYIYTAQPELCDSEVTSRAICGMETLAGRDWFISEAGHSPGVSVPDTEAIYVPCHVRGECAEFEFPAVHRSRHRGADVTYYTGIVLISPLCLVMLSVLPFAVLGCFVAQDASGHESSESEDVPASGYTQNDLDRAKWRSTARHSIHLAATRNRSGTRKRADSTTVKMATASL